MLQPPKIELDDAKAAGLGSLLQRARAESSLSVQDVAKDLLLSKGQVLGLESGVAKSFYSARIYVQAAKKYCAYLNLDFDAGQLLAVPPAAPPEVVEQLAAAAPRGPAAQWLPTRSGRLPGASLARDARVWLGMAGLAVLVLVYVNPLSLSGVTALVGNGAGGVAAAGEQLAPASETSPAQELARRDAGAGVGGPALVAARPDAGSPMPLPGDGLAEGGSTQAEPDAGKPEAQAAGKGGAGDLRLTFAKPSWVEAVYSHSEAIRQTFQPGQELVLEHLGLKSLVIGNFAAVRVYQREKPLDVEAIRKPSGNVVRFSGEELARLMQQTVLTN